MDRNRIIHLILVILVVVLSIALFVEFRTKRSLDLGVERTSSLKQPRIPHRGIPYPALRSITRISDWSRFSATEWDPLYELDKIHRWMESWFNRVGQSMGFEEGYPLARFEPQIEIEETDDSYIIRCDLPGMSKDQIEIKIEGQYLTISGKREIVREKSDDKIFYTERRSGYFQRRIILPEDSDKDNVKATYENGILTITIPKLKERIVPKFYKVQII